MSALSESEALHARARAFVRAFERGVGMPESFDALACDIARFQASNVAGYARLCRARGVDAKALSRASQAPAVPTDAFKVARVFAFENAAFTFRTSGTTVGARGSHFFRDVGTYDAAALAFGRRALAADHPLPILVVGPPPREAPDSSLTHMIDLFVRAFGEPAAEEETYFVRNGALDAGGFVARAKTLDRPALVLGTSFGYVHLLDAGARVAFPSGTRAMQTGGFKGRAREVDAAELKQAISRAFAIDAIVGEYGMTELSSQFYEEAGVYVEPPWARVVPVDPETLAPVAAGEVGIARIEDLMNVDSAFAVLAADRVRRVDRGFQLLGRAPGAPPRGCSLAVDEILG